jgi:pimeloyl-ACP methyl ester carboxylesterase
MSVGNVVFKVAAAAGAAFGGAALANVAIARSAPQLDEWYEGERAAYFWRGYRIAYTVRGEGRPVVLLHGIHAAASSYEWRHNFAYLSERYRVYAVDLLGFGHSDRPAADYRAETYESLLVDFLRDVPLEPPAVVASSLTAAYAVVATHRAPQHVAGLVLVCPTGLTRLARPQGPLESFVQGALTAPVVGQSLYNVLASDASIRYYLRNQVFASPDAIDEAIVRQMYATSHQPGARYAPAAFVGGALNADVSEIFPRLNKPTLVVWGAQARMAPASDAEAFAAGNPSARVAIVDGAGLLPHDERAGWFNGIVSEFIA